MILCIVVCEFVFVVCEGILYKLGVGCYTWMGFYMFDLWVTTRLHGVTTVRTFIYLLRKVSYYNFTCSLYGRENCCLTLRNRRSVFENRVLRRTLGFKRNGMTGEWRKLQTSKLHNLHSSLNNIRMMKSRRTKRTDYVSYVGQNRTACWVFVGKAEGNRTFGRPSTDGRIWTGLIWLRMGTSVGVLWIKQRKFLLHKMRRIVFTSFVTISF